VPLLVDAREPALSPDGTTLAFVQSIDDRFQLVVAPFDGQGVGPRRQLTRGAGHAAFPVWSPGGEALLVLTRTVRDDVQFDTRYGQVHLWLVLGDGSAPLQLTESASLSIRRPIWTEDGIWLVAGTGEPPYGRAVWRITLSAELQARLGEPPRSPRP
jgi:Tol biopolymer transport system component